MKIRYRILSCHADRLDQQTGRRVENIVFLHCAHIAVTAFTVFPDEIIFFIGNFDFLDAHNGFFNPFVQTAVIILVLDARLTHNRL